MKLKTGNVAPNFGRSDIYDKLIQLNEDRNGSTLLSFFRYAECALCNLRIAELKRASERFKELDIEVICVFQSEKEKLRKAIHDRHSLDFLIISDPKMELYNLYGVKPSWLKLARTTSRKGMSNILKAQAEGYKLGGKVDGKFHQIPADFLINQNQRIEIAHYGNNLVDHIPIDEIIKKATTR
jgi:peroxiredoxin